VTSTLVRFTGNFKTFVVSDDEGRMVPYQGAMIGKRMVILADTENAKSLARKEMQTVLAAAITTLGANQSITLSQIESVVLDLR
jgi:roadblock/LC7 domain-containing protein